jgi:membrane-associated phospholipid phosphatase
MPGEGFVDTLAKYEPLHYTSIPSWWVNQYAAMPSFHFGWMLLIGVATSFIARTQWLKLLGILLPFIMLVSIIATGNHFILDAVAGGIVMVLAYVLNLLLLRVRNKYRTQTENRGKNKSGSRLLGWLE